MLSGPPPVTKPDTAIRRAASARSTSAATISRAVAMARPSSAPLSALPGLDALLGQKTLQLAGLEHLAHDIAAADELALHVELRDGRPVRVRLDAGADLVGFEDIDALVADAEVIEDL